MRRGWVIMAAAFLVASALVPAAAAVGTQTDATAAVEAPGVAQSEANTTWEQPGPFDLEELRRGGVRDSAAPESARNIGMGGVLLQYTPINPLSNGIKRVSPGETLNGDILTLYSNAYGDTAGEYEFVVVYWNQETAQVGDSTREYAANQTVQRIDVQFGEGYSTSEVELQSHYDESVQATAWLEKGGERVPGARWRFQHASAPASQQVQIDTLADAWTYVFRVAILPGIASVILGLSLAKLTLKRTGTGPRYGRGAWVFLGLIGGGLALSGLYYEVAVIIANLDILMGLSLGVIAFGGGLRIHSDVEHVGFERKELTSAIALRKDRGDSSEDKKAVPDGGAAKATDSIEIPEGEYHDELYEDLPRLPMVRGEDGRFIPKKGIGPFIARFFADAARLDLSSLTTRVRVNTGCIAEKVYVHPDSDGVQHTAAHLARRMPVWHRIDPENAETGDKLMYGALTALTVALPYIGWKAGAAVANVPTIGAAAGALVLAVESLEARSGSVEFTPAPRHDVTADASLTILQQEHADAKTLEEYEQIAWDERTKTAVEAREVQSRQDRTVTRRLNEKAVGMDLDVETRRDVDAEAPLGGPEPDVDDSADRTEARPDGGENDE
jgi:hypothetical protein